MLASSSKPFLEDFCVDSFGIIQVFVGHDPFLSSRSKVPNLTYLVAISTGMLSTFPSVYVNFSSSGRVGLVPGLHVACKDYKTRAVVTKIILRLVAKACKNITTDSYTHSAGGKNLA